MVHGIGVGGLIGLIEHVLGNHTVLFHNIGKHIPLAAVMHAGLKNEGDGSVVRCTVCRVEHALQEIIGALEFIPERKIALRQFKLFQIQLFCDLFTQHIGGGKQPAAAGMLLIGYIQCFDVNGKLVAHFACRF